VKKMRKLAPIAVLTTVLTVGGIVPLFMGEVNIAQAAVSKELSQTVSIDDDGVITVKSTGPDYLFVNIIDRSRDKVVMRSQVKTGYTNKFKGFVPGDYAVKTETYNSSTRDSKFTDDEDITITDDMFYPEMPSNMEFKTSIKDKYNILRVTVNPIESAETQTEFTLYDPTGEEVATGKGTKTRDGVYYEFRILTSEIVVGTYKVTAETVKYGNRSKALEKEIEAGDFNAPLPDTPVINDISVSDFGEATVKFSTSGDSTTLYIFDEEDKVVFKKGATVSKDIIVTEELPQGQYKAVIETKRKDFGTLAKSKPEQFEITELQSAPPVPDGPFASDIAVGIFRENKDSKVAFKAALPFVSPEGKFYVSIKDPNGKVIASGYSRKSGDNAEFSANVNVDKIDGGEYTFEIKGEKFKKQTDEVEVKITLPNSLPDLYWEAHHQ